MTDERFFTYARVMAGHEGCGVARWVWVSGGERVFGHEWLCPVCGMFLGMEGTRQARTVNVPEGCAFVAEVES